MGAHGSRGSSSKMFYCAPSHSVGSCLSVGRHFIGHCYLQRNFDSHATQGRSRQLRVFTRAGALRREVVVNFFLPMHWMLLRPDSLGTASTAIVCTCLTLIANG